MDNYFIKKINGLGSPFVIAGRNEDVDIVSSVLNNAELKRKQILSESKFKIGQKVKFKNSHDVLNFFLQLEDGDQRKAMERFRNALSSRYEIISVDKMTNYDEINSICYTGEDENGFLGLLPESLILLA